VATILQSDDDLLRRRTMGTEPGQDTGRVRRLHVM